MPNQFASGKYAIAQCDRCNFRFKLKQLKSLVIKTKNVNILVCPEFWEPDQPQLWSDLPRHQQLFSICNSLPPIHSLART